MRRYSMDCPRCNEKMAKEEIDGEMIAVCHDCGGMWLQRNQLNKMIIEGEGDFESASVDSSATGGEMTTLSCPECDGSIMGKVNFLHYSDIILDHCDSCGGFWLDQGELERIHGYVRQVETGSHKVKDYFVYNIIARISDIAYRIFH